MLCYGERMPECPWCQAPVTEPRFPCRSCGRRPKDHVSFSAQQAGAAAAPLPAPAAAALLDAPAEPAFELDFAQPAAASPSPVASAHPSPVPDIPDLILETRPRPSGKPAGQVAPPTDPNKPPSLAPPPAKPAPRKLAAATASSSFDEGMDLTDGPGGGSIDLAGDAAPEWTGGTGSPAAAAPSGPRGAAAKPASSALAATDDGGLAAARALAAYGDAPRDWWKTPFYAYHVLMRQRELRSALATKRVEVEKARAASDDALVVLAERGRTLAATKDIYKKLLDPVAVAESALRERDGALAAATEAHKRETSGLDASIAAEEHELAGARAEEKAYADQFAAADAVRQRADARVKRIDIELRAAVARAGGGAGAARGGGGESGPPSARAPEGEVLARTAEREARLAELEQAMPAVTEATQKLTAARRRVTGIQQKILAVKNQRASLEDQFKKRGEAHGAGVASAQKAVREAMVALGRAIGGDELTFGPDWNEPRVEIHALDTKTAAREDEALLHVMALDAHDRSAVQKGLALVAGACALVALLVAIPVVLAVAGGGKPQHRPQIPEGSTEISE